MFSRSLIVVFLAVQIAILGLTGCQSAGADAQKLLADKKYQEVINKFPDTQFARRARALMAEDLLAAGKAEQVMKEFPDTRAAFLAREEQAKTLYNNKEYARVLAEFPNSPLATEAERVLAEELYAAGKFDELIMKYGKSDRGKQVKEERATADFEAAKKMKGDKQVAALEAIMRTYTETAAYKEAANLLRDVRKPGGPGAKPTLQPSLSSTPGGSPAPLKKQ